MIDFFGTEPEVFEAPRPGSTDWMDGLRTAQDVIDKNKLVIWCSACNSWFHFEDDPERTSVFVTSGLECSCGSSSGLIGSTIRSERTWTIYTKPPVKKKRR